MTEIRSCGTCGLGLSDDLGTRVVLQLDYEDLQALFRGEYDQASTCGRRNCPETQPTILLVSSFWPAAIYGYANTATDSSQIKFVESIIAEKADPILSSKLPDSVDVVDWHSDPDSLRESLGAAWAPIVTDCATFGTMISQDLSKILEHCRLAQPIMFSVAALSIDYPLDGRRFTAHLPDGSEADRDVAIQKLAFLQASAWWTLTSTHFVDNLNIPTLEEDLRYFVDICSILPGTMAHVETYSERYKANSQDPFPWTLYCVEALRVSVAKKADLLSELETEWPLRYVITELDIRKENGKPSWQIAAKHVSTDRARETISSSDFQELVMTIVNIASGYDHENSSESEEESIIPDNWIKLLFDIAQGLGYGSEMGQLIQDRVIVTGLEDAPLEKYQKIFDDMQSVSKLESVQGGVALMFNTLVSAERASELSQLARLLTTGLAGQPDRQAEVLIALGVAAKNGRRPDEFLSVATGLPLAWENQVEESTRVALETERSNALRLAGETQAALDALDRSDPFEHVLSPHDLKLRRVNRAILRRENGELDRPLTDLRTMFSEAGDGATWFSVGEALAATLLFVGEFEEAALITDSLLRELPSRGHEALRVRLTTMWLQALAGSDQASEAIATIRKLRGADIGSPGVLGLAAAVSTLGTFWQAEDAEEYREVAEECLQLLEEAQLRASDAGDDIVEVGATRLIAILADKLGEEGRLAEAYDNLYRLAQSKPNALDASDLVAAALRAYDKGADETARSLLASVPDVLATTIGAGQDLAILAGSTFSVSGPLRRLVDLLQSTTSNPGDHRLASELRRESASRAVAVRRSGERQSNVLHEGLGDEVIERMAVPDRSVAVLEWSAGSRAIGAAVTIIRPHGKGAEFRWLRAPSVDPADVVRRLAPRLRLWTSATPGDPFDLPEWHSLRDWLQGEFRQVVPPESHVVVLETADYSGLPWHTALVDDWSCSYAPSWTDLLDLNEPPDEPIDFVLGSATIPRFKEDKSVVRAYDEADERLRSLVDEYAVAEHLHLRNGDADIEAIVGLFGTATVVRLLCHGFVDPRDSEVALMVASDGRLPPGDSISIQSESAVHHKLSWRELQLVASMPKAILTTACSSGLSHFAGVGDRLGLYRAFRWGGARVLVAPRWDVLANATIPILDRVTENLLSGSEIASAVRNATLDARPHEKEWVSTSLAIEGDWKWKLSMN